MVKKSKRHNDYTVGYARPPVETRFSALHQPPRRKPVTPPRKSTLDLSLELVTVRMEGVATTMTSDDLVDEMMIQRALEGRLRDLRDLYARLDAEEDRMLAEPPRFARDKLMKDLAPFIQQLTREARELLDLEIAYRDLGGTLKLTAWAKQALLDGPPD